MTELVLGISAHFHDSAAALVADGKILAAAQEERFTRRRHDPSFPRHAIDYCLREAGITLGDVTAIAYYENPRLKFNRILATYAGIAPHGFATFREVIPEWLPGKLRTAANVRRELARVYGRAVPPVTTRLHHESHAASAFFPSPFESAAILCIDGVGEWTTTSIWKGIGDHIEPLTELRFPHSLGLLYSAFTYFCGFKVDSGEYKLMGLAPYGKPRYEPLIRDRLIDIKPDGSFRLNMDYFEFLRGRVMTGRGFEQLFGGARRPPEAPLTSREFDLAASVQAVTEDVVCRLAASARRLTGERQLCMAGGVALNCVANGKLVRDQLTDELWVQPAAGDAGGSLGAALLVSSAKPPRSRPDGMSGALLGPGFGDEAISSFLEQRGLPAVWLAEEDLVTRIAAELAAGKVVGWFQGRMEFGPRALGSRSILADPRDRDMQRTMNLKIKFRESFRPFAPAVLERDADEYFDLRQPSPYMLLVGTVTAGKRLQVPDEDRLAGLDLLKAQRSVIPAVTHVDQSARVQTVARAVNPLFHRLLTCFKQLTGCPVLVNTSFNVRGEPIVCTPEDAYTCFMRTNMDLLALGRFVLDKADQPPAREDDWRNRIPLD
jgi:carbamoyltransferase